MNITEFLEARIAEDEAAARAAAVSTGGTGWSAQQLDHEGLSVYGDDAAGQIDFDSEEAVPTLRYFVRFDPARVLAECAVKRAIIEQADEATGLDMSVDNDRLAGARDMVKEPYCGDLILRSLATIYSDHPDYQPEWALADS